MDKETAILLLGGGTATALIAYTLLKKGGVLPDGETSRFAVVSDTHGARNGSWPAISRMIENHSPAFVLHCGDLMQDESNWNEYLQGEQNLTSPVYPSLGNHDYDSQLYYDHFRVNYFYSTDIGDMHIVSMDTEKYVPTQATLLEADLSATQQPRKIIFFHSPAYSCGTMHGSDQQIQDHWVPVIDRHEVDIVFQGHDHIYQRSAPINGTRYIVVPSAGGDIGYQSYGDYLVSPQPWVEYAQDSFYGYLLVDVGATLEVSCYSIGGELIDRFVV